MTCPDQYDLSLFAGGDLRGHRAHRIEQHLHGCPACAQSVDEFQLVRSAVADSGSPIPPRLRTTLAPEVLSRIALEQSTPPTLSIGNRLRWGIAAVATACASIAIWGLQPAQHSLDLPLSALVTARPPTQAFVLSRPFRIGSPAPPSTPAIPEAVPDPLNVPKLSLISDALDGDEDALFHIPSNHPSIEVLWLMD